MGGTNVESEWRCVKGFNAKINDQMKSHEEKIYATCRLKCNNRLSVRRKR